MPDRDRDFIKVLIQSTSDGIVCMDREFRYTIFNPGMEEITGRKSSEVLGKTVKEAFPFLLDTGAIRYHERALAGESCTSPEQAFFIRESNRAGYFEGKYSPLYNEKNEIVGVLGIVRDTTERKIAEDKRLELVRAQVLTRVAAEEKARLKKILQEKEQLEATLSLAMEATQMGVFECDLITRKATTSLRLDQIFGCAGKKDDWTSEEILGRIHPEDRGSFSDEIRCAIRKGKIFNLKARVLWPNGSTRWVMFRGKSSLNEKGDPIRFAGVLAEISKPARQPGKENAVSGHASVSDFTHKPKSGNLPISPPENGTPLSRVGERTEDSCGS